MRMQGVARTSAEPKLSRLYEADEVAWLERSAELIKAKRFRELDYKHLREFLLDMARSEKREVGSRLRQLLVHLLKWEFQPRRRSRSWSISIMNQRAELADVLDCKTLENHAHASLDDIYTKARKLAAGETELDLATFPERCPYSIEFLMSDMLPD